MKTVNRRNFLVGMGVAAGGLAFHGLTAKAASCGLTPEQQEGPFYPGDINFTSDTDLTRLPGGSARALGQVIYVRGKVTDANCQPVPNANVEIWQACASGRYNNPRDSNTAPLDPNFRYWAETFTDAEGNYSFKSIQPGSYPAAPGWIRPSHIHVHVSRLGFYELTTQLYFASEKELNEKDFILQGEVPAADRAKVVVDFQPSGSGFEAGSLTGTFDISLRPVRAR